MKPMHVVEAALFSAGRALSVQDIVERTGLAEKEVQKAVKTLAAAYAERDTALEVGKAGTKWAMQVRAQAAEPAAKFARMEIAPKLLKTLALIAYHQPMKQSELVDMIGTKVYDHIPELKELGLVRARQDGSTKLLSTTARFPEYFGLDAANPDQIRTVMGRLVGIEAPKRRKEKGIEGFASMAPEAAAPVVEGAPEAAPEAEAVTDGAGAEAITDRAGAEAVTDGAGAEVGSGPEAVQGDSDAVAQHPARPVEPAASEEEARRRRDEMAAALVED